MSLSHTLPVGTKLRDYMIDDILGSGGFGITYKARDVRLSSVVAIKEYFPIQLAVRKGDQTVASRSGNNSDDLYQWGLRKFLDEANSLAKLHHPSIVGVNFLFQANDTVYMVLDYIQGYSLKDWLTSIRRAPTTEELLALSMPLLDALEAIHDAGLLHRDIAPKNIMLDRSDIADASDINPILIDFGAVRLLVAQHSQTIANALTPGYAPPEQHSNRGQGPWTDIYALSATLYFAMSNKVPPNGLERMMEDTYVPIAAVARRPYDPKLFELVDWGLRPHPKDRPQTVAAWRERFDGIKVAAASAAPQAGLLSRWLRLGRQRPA